MSNFLENAEDYILGHIFGAKAGRAFEALINAEVYAYAQQEGQVVVEAVKAYVAPKIPALIAQATEEVEEFKAQVIAYLESQADSIIDTAIKVAAAK
jgi:hypothetical protein